MKKKIIGILAVILVIALGAGGYALYRHTFPTQAGHKTITLTVTSNELNTTKTVETECEYLGDALREAELIEGENQSQGYFVTRVCGIESDSANGYYWMLYKDGEMLNTGVDTTPIADGEAYEFRCEQFTY